MKKTSAILYQSILKIQWLQTNHSNYRKSGDPVCGIILSRCNLIRPWTTGYGWNRCDLRDQKMGSYSDHRDFCKEQRIRESKMPWMPEQMTISPNPFGNQELLARIRTALRHRRQPMGAETKTPMYHAGQLKMILISEESFLEKKNQLLHRLNINWYPFLQRMQERLLHMSLSSKISGDLMQIRTIGFCE